MAKNTLVRESLAVPETVNLHMNKEMRELALKSRAILGYRLLQSIIIPRKTLREVLRELDIKPFSKESVEKYKAKAQKKAQAELDKEGDNDEQVRWRMRTINSYTEPIPEFVLNKAIQIQEGMPDANLGIEQLTTERPDPFLVALYGNERYYIEVWDEPHFENKLLRGTYISDYDDDDDDAEED